MDSSPAAPCIDMVDPRPQQQQQQCVKCFLLITDADGSCELDWHTRYKIIEGICNGLHYLHEQIDKTIHLDLKPGNVLLDDNLAPKISDFGLSRLLDQHQTICSPNRVGTL
jgi:serine/threonine protein kinase